MDPAAYEDWYRTPRGRWIADAEFELLAALARPAGFDEAGPEDRLLDAGCGTGHFSRRFAAAGLEVAGVDVDQVALAYAQSLGGSVGYTQSSMLRLPFPDGTFDIACAVTSLCFVADAAAALAELWRVSRRGVLLGLLNRHSLLYRRKHGRGAYRGARWDTVADVHRWAASLAPAPECVRAQWAVYMPEGGSFARWVEALLPQWLPWGGFLAIWIEKPVGGRAQTV